MPRCSQATARASGLPESVVKRADKVIGLLSRGEEVAALRTDADHQRDAIHGDTLELFLGADLETISDDGMVDFLTKVVSISKMLPARGKSPVC